MPSHLLQQMRVLFLLAFLGCVVQGSMETCATECFFQTCDVQCGGCPIDVMIGHTVQAYMTQMQNMTNETAILQIITAVKAVSLRATQMYSDNYVLSCNLNCDPSGPNSGFIIPCLVDCQDCNPRGLCVGIIRQMDQIFNQTNLSQPVEQLANTTYLFCEPYVNMAGRHEVHGLWLGLILLGLLCLNPNN